MKLHVICVAYERPVHLRGLIASFLLQTNPNWELNIIHDGKASQSVRDAISLYNDDRIRFFESEQRNQCYGHPNRKMMLQKLKGVAEDFLLMTNDDNYYVPVFVEYMLAQCNHTIGMVYCDTIHSHFGYGYLHTLIKVNNIDMGSFIVNLYLAQNNGFNHVIWTADGLFAEECAERCKKQGLRIVYIPKPLFIHN